MKENLENTVELFTDVPAVATRGPAAGGQYYAGAETTKNSTEEKKIRPIIVWRHLLSLKA